jgi:starvation-inducible DNA-binding protein
MKVNIGIQKNNLNEITNVLSQVLADQVTLYTKTRKFHWNVKGESFMELHKLFENQYSQLEEQIDTVAERIGKLGANSIGTMSEFLKLTCLKEHPGKHSTSKQMLEQLLQDHETIIINLRKAIDDCSGKYCDAGTADILTGLMTNHETIAWVLRRYNN